MLKLTKRADYGLIALCHLALRRQQSASAKGIAEAYGLPLPLLSKVLQKLARHGLLISVPGTNGGYRLARDPRLISVLEVVRIIDGPILLTSCSTAERTCFQSPRCRVKEPLRRIQERMLQLLEHTSISEMGEEAPTVIQPI